ncbi:MAG: serine/threonine protein kinase, partial [Nannocystaceae bacterium]|nr:serine/threonine protein kinase [Nannocystaceae bacterium]
MDECLDAPALREVLDGRLNRDDRDAALAHFEECAQCRDRVARGYGADSPIQTESRPMASGVRIGSRYTLCDPIGEGAWGEVWSAFDERLRRNIAVKILRFERVINPDDHFRMIREAETLARLRHSGIVAVHDSGNFEGRPFLVMDLIKGVPLPVHLEQSKPTSDDILALFRHAGSGLDAAHRAGIVHRDFKPANLLIDRAGRLLITDFGLATRAGAATPLPPEKESGDPESMLDLRLTPTHGCLGTPAYLAPELLRGETATPMSDQFAFCVSLVETLTASPLMTADDVRRGGIERGELKARLLPILPRLRPVLMRGLDPDASRRYPDLDALLDDVRIRGRRRLVRRVIAAGPGLAGLAAIASLALTEVRICLLYTSD